MQGLPFGCLTAGGGAGVQVVAEVGEGFVVVAFGGGGDSPDAGGEVGGPFGVAAVVVLPADDGGAQGAVGYPRRIAAPG